MDDFFHFSVNLPKSEIFIYSLVYVVFLIHGILKVYLLGEQYVKDKNYGFTDGWSFIGLRKDDSDYEWKILKSVLTKSHYWYIAHIVMTEICRLIAPKRLPSVFAVIGLAYILANFQIQNSLLFIAQMIITCLIIHLKSTKIVWLGATVCLAFINFVLKNSPHLSHPDTYEEYFSIILMLSWNVLKSISYSVDAINCTDEQKQSQYNIENFCAYFLYFPSMQFGPIMIYDRFLTFSGKLEINWQEFQTRLVELLKNLVRIGFWILFTDFALHFLYVNFYKFNPAYVKKLNCWALFGYGYLMGQFFCNYYVISYGIPIAMAKFDRIDPPKPPKCIGRIHFYSDMWKYFDHGLYEFLVKYIYVVICKLTSGKYLKTLGSIATFSFIFFWHGFYMFVFVWAFMNLICLTVERYFKMGINSPNYQNFISKYLSPKNQMRLYGLMGSQIFIPATISNFYFFSGMEVGNLFVKRAYTSGILVYLSLTFCCYCVFQCCEMVWQWERSKVQPKQA